MSVTLDELEQRVFGVLLEKSLAQPAYYPMTLPAVVAACNQKNNREPLMELDEDAVWTVLDKLRERGLVSRVLPSGSARSDRFKHEVAAVFGWEKPQRAVMTELLLRGPQTVGELRGRASRLYAFENVESVAAVLDFLAGQTPPLVAVQPRAVGQSAARWSHLLYPPGQGPPPPPNGPAEASTTGHATPVATAPARGAAPGGPGGGDVALRTQLDALQEELAELRRRVEQLEQR